MERLKQLLSSIVQPKSLQHAIPSWTPTPCSWRVMSSSQQPCRSSAAHAAEKWEALPRARRGCHQSPGVPQTVFSTSPLGAWLFRTSEGWVSERRAERSTSSGVSLGFQNSGCGRGVCHLLRNDMKSHRRDVDLFVGCRQGPRPHRKLLSARNTCAVPTQVFLLTLGIRLHVML